MKRLSDQPKIWDISPKSPGYQDESDVTFLALPGVLAHGDPKRTGGWIRPLVPMLLERGELAVVDVGNSGPYSAQEVIDLTAEQINKIHQEQRRAVLLGSSIGGNTAVFAMDAAQNVTEQNTASILMDSPYGIDTFKMLASTPQVLRKRIGRVAEVLSQASFIDGPLTPMFDKLYTSPSGLPKDEEIAYIKDDWTRAYVMGDPDAVNWGEQQFYGGVKDLAAEGLRGNSPSMYFGQVGWMDRIDRDGSYGESLAKVKAPVYAACSDEKMNATVVQPLAGERHKDANRDIQVVNIDDTPHVALLQKTELWQTAIGRMLDDLEVPAVNQHLRQIAS